MIVLDTSIIVELMKPQSPNAIAEWLSAQPAASTVITAITQAELLFSASMIPPGDGQDRLLAAITAKLADFAGRIVPFDQAAAQAFGPIVVKLKQTSHAVPLFQVQIAAIAQARGAAVATRHPEQFVNCGIELVEPK